MITCEACVDDICIILLSKRQLEINFSTGMPLYVTKNRGASPTDVTGQQSIVKMSLAYQTYIFAHVALIYNRERDVSLTIS